MRVPPPGLVAPELNRFHDNGDTARDGHVAANGPDLLPRVAEMGPNRRVGLMLNRYTWSLSGSQSRSERDAGKALIDDVLQRKGDALKMPIGDGRSVGSCEPADLMTLRDCLP